MNLFILKRFNLWLATDNIIAQHNRKFESGLVTFKMAHNFMSDLTQEEKEQRRGLKLPKGFSKSNDVKEMAVNLSLPSSVDWRSVVQPIKDQGQCGYKTQRLFHH